MNFDPLLEFLFFAVTALIVPLIGLIGLWVDSEHRKNLLYRRQQVGHVMVTDLKTFPQRAAGSLPPVMITAEFVLANNALLTLFARFKMFFGGEVKSFHGVVTRLRQEVTVRLMEQAAAAGYNAVGNIRLEGEEGNWTGAEYGMGEDSDEGLVLRPRMMLLTGDGAYAGLSAMLQRQAQVVGTGSKKQG